MKKRRGYLDEIRLNKKRRRQRKLLFIFAIAAIFASAAIYSLFYSGIFSLTTFNVVDYKEIDKASLDNLIAGYLDEKIFLGLIARKSNFLLFSETNLSQKIIEDYPQLTKADLNLVLIKNYLNIFLDKRETAGTWCFNATVKCFLFDNTGLLFQETESLKNNLVVADDNAPKNLREVLPDKEMVDKIIEANRVLEILDFVSYKNFYVPANSFSDFWIKTSEGWNIYLDKTTDVTEQLYALDELLAKKISPEKRSALQYMDLRIQSRIYYK